MAHLTGQERARYVTRMFARISRRYDLLNTVMTGGRHYAWRKRATGMAVEGLSGPALDIATGTGDFAFDLARRPEVTDVVGLDFTRDMLKLANVKASRQELSRHTTFTAGDAHALPFKDEQFICATVGFGIRNFIDLPTALQEMVRVVRPGGRVVSLEIVRMEGRGPMPKLLPLHFRYVTPWLG
ncbi:MAG: class I SAM-dependent methyltransferase, partial [SAR202 cluster bacterium]|nr:class I SAM-dependent methyltransferase [SAR202 cluster bacterium]